jgi:flagellar motor switch protein FliN/FliY
MIDDIENEEDGGLEFNEPEISPILDKNNADIFEHKKRRAIFTVPVPITVAVGRAKPLIGELLNMRREAIIPLDTKINDPVELWVGEHMIARGELQEMDDNSGRLSVRLTEVVEIENIV